MKNKLLSLIIKEKNIIFSGLILGLVLFMLYMAFAYKPVFTTSAKLFIRDIPKVDITNINEFGGLSTIKSESGFSNPLLNMLQIIESGTLSSRVYNSVKTKYPDDLKRLRINSEESWNKKFAKIIRTKVEPSTDVITISLSWIKNDHAKDVLQDVIKEFKLINLDIKKSVEMQQRQYLDGHLFDISNKLDDIRRQIRDYKLSNRAVNVSDETTQLTMARIDLEKQAELLSSQISYNERKYNNIASQLGFPTAKMALRATAIGNDIYLDKIRQDLSVAEQNYARLSARFTDNYPEVIAAKNEIESVKNNIQKRMKESLGDIMVRRGVYDKPSQDIVTDMARVQAEKISLASQLSRLKRGIDNIKARESLMPDKILGLEELQKQENALITSYNSIKQKQLEARVKENEVVDNIMTLGSPTKPEFQLANILVKFLTFLSFGFIGALGVAWVKEDIEDRWGSVSEIEEITGKKVLGVIPWVKQKIDGIEVSDRHSVDVMNVAYKNLVNNIISESYIKECQIISFSSTFIARERSCIVPNIASVFSRLGKSLIVIDTNFANPEKLLECFNVERRSEIDILDIIDSVNRQIRLEGTVNQDLLGKMIHDATMPVRLNGNNEDNIGFMYLGTNKQTDEIYNYIATRGFRVILDFLRRHNEFIFIDTPPLPFIFPEIYAINDSADAAILILSRDTSRMELIKIIENLDKTGKKTLGIIQRQTNSELETVYNSSKNADKDPIGPISVTSDEF